jgi:glutathione S-transferase
MGTGPYCQKVWMYLEEKRIPYRVSKVSIKRVTVRFTFLCGQ